MSTALPRAHAHAHPFPPPHELSSAAAASRADDTVDEEDAYEFDGEGTFTSKCSAHPHPPAPSRWPLMKNLFKRRGNNYSSLPQFMPLLSGPDSDNEKPLSYVRAAWGRVGSRLPPARRPLTALTSPRNVRRVFMVVATVLMLALVGLGINTRLVRPPPYQLVPRQEYVSALSNFVQEHNLTAFAPPSEESEGGIGFMTEPIAAQLGALKNRLYALAVSARCAGSQHTTLVPRPVPHDQPPSHIPSTMFSSDRAPLPANESAAWRQSWEDRGFSPVTFLEEAAADAFVDRDFGPGRNKANFISSGNPQTAIQKAWKALPRGVLRADFMRYLLLLSRGGTWADMDVEPMGNLSTWTIPEARWIPVPRVSRRTDADDPSCASLLTSQGQLRLPPPEPVRLVVGLECEPWQYMQHSDRAWLESARILAMPRHREVQFTQWTLHGAPGHPVLIDVLRRLVAADKIFDEYRATHTPFRREATHPWTNIAAARKWILSDASPEYPGSTDDDSPSWLRWRIWPWQWAWPRWGWHPLSVEEWTGPALWTDAVFTYLNAVAGLHPRDLYGLNEPVQVADVIVAPNSWFAPPRDDLAQAKVLHNFRGSWKHGADIPPEQGAEAPQFAHRKLGLLSTTL